MAYDTKCYDLASAFLEDELRSNEKDCCELAQLIQTTIDDWISFTLKDREPPDPPGFEGGFAANH